MRSRVVVVRIVMARVKGVKWLCSTSRVAVHSPLTTSHNRALESFEPVANIFPSGQNATLATMTSPSKINVTRGKGCRNSKGCCDSKGQPCGDS